ncbi:MAG: ABC-F family ATP-binding cassette domain-containing protein [Anaerolineae bacterium]|nr:ABC-F family ATP-binding cassette domain-containing protein [Anaerolineae bacterium]
MILARLNHITFSYPTQLILDDLDWEIHSNRVTGLLGVNGCGKSTLLKLLTGQLVADSGSLVIHNGTKIAYLEQEPFLQEQATVWHTALQANADILSIDSHLRQIEESLAQPENYYNEKKLSRLLNQQEQFLREFEDAGGLNYESRVRSTLCDFGFEEAHLPLPVEKLSGGQKKLLALARLTLSDPDLLLLDEPDNHLDMEGKDRLQRFINRFQGAVVIVTHDRYLLDLVVDEIIELEMGKLAFYPGSYSEYAYEKEHRRANALKAFENQQREISRLEQAAKRLLTWGVQYNNEKLVYRGQAILKRIEHMEKLEAPPEPPKKMDLTLNGWRGSNLVLRIENLNHAFQAEDDRAALNLFDSAELELLHGERVGLVGPNGSGKSMLLKFVLGESPYDQGRITVGPSVSTAYYSQQHETLDLEKTLVANIQDAHSMSDQRAVAFLTKFRYSYKQMRDPARYLSGGERSRLQLAMMMLSGANFLLMDEPTNHLDIASTEVLEENLADFVGSLLIVSHDRYFLDRICTRIVAIENRQLVSYPGNFSSYQGMQKKQVQ